MIALWLIAGLFIIEALLVVFWFIVKLYGMHNGKE